MARRCGKRQSKPEGREFDIRLVTSVKNVRPSEVKKCPPSLPSKVHQPKLCFWKINVTAVRTAVQEDTGYNSSKKLGTREPLAARLGLGGGEMSRACKRNVRQGDSSTQRADDGGSHLPFLKPTSCTPMPH